MGIVSGSRRWSKMHSSPAARAPKSQLAVEQPSTGGCLNLPKSNKQKIRYTMSKNKEKATVRWYVGHNHDKIKSRQVGDSQTGEQ